MILGEIRYYRGCGVKGQIFALKDMEDFIYTQIIRPKPMKQNPKPSLFAIDQANPVYVKPKTPEQAWEEWIKTPRGMVFTMWEDKGSSLDKHSLFVRMKTAFEAGAKSREGK